MIWTLAWRSLMVHPLRSLVLACGFGLGVSVMATLLGVGDVILEQARSPARAGGGDLVVASTTGRLSAARFLLANVLGAPPLRDRVVAAAPSQRQYLYLVEQGRTTPLLAIGGVPSLERALGDPETAAVAGWVDAPADHAWSAPEPGALLRSMDAFHAVPDVPTRASSWAEWLYFNGQKGDARFYLTFFVGPQRAKGGRVALVRLQLDRGGHTSNYSAFQEIDEGDLLARAPELDVALSHVRLSGTRYVLKLDVPAELKGRPAARGEIVLEATPGRAMPPFTLRGSAGWQSGYVVPVMSGGVSGSLALGSETVSFDGGQGYHDHNWGFWEGVSWRWGQVQNEGVSFVFGRVFPPAEAADPEHLPGFLGAIGPNGPLGFSTDVRIEETGPVADAPSRVVVRGHGPNLDLTLDLAVSSVTRTRVGAGGFGGDMDFLQLRGRYHVNGRAGERRVDFEAPGAAETFRRR